MARYITGQDREQLVLFAEKIDDMIGEENQVRVIDKFVDCLELEKMGIVRSMPNMKGTNSYNPRDILKLYLYGYTKKVRSSRKLAELCKTNVEVIWLMKRLTPDFRTISDFRKENKKALKNVFKELILMCKELDMISGKFSQDGVKIEAVNSKEKNYTLNKIDDRIKRIDKEIEKYLKEMEETDKKESGEKKLEVTEEKLNEYKKKKKELDAIREEMERKNETQKSLTDKESRLMKNNGKFSVCYNNQVLVDTKSHIVVNYDADNNPADVGTMEKLTSEAKEILKMEEEIVENITDQGYKDRKDMKKCLESGIIPEVTLGKNDKEYEIEFDYKENKITEKMKKSKNKKDIKKCLEAGVIPEVYKDVLKEIEIIEKTELECVEDIEAKEEIDTNDIRDMAMENECFIRDKKRDIVYCPMGETLRKKSKHREGIKYCNKMACKGCKKPCTMAKFKEIVMRDGQIILSTSENKKGRKLKEKYNSKKRRKKVVKKKVKVKLIPREEDLKLRMGTSEHPHGTMKRTDDMSYFLLKGKEKVNAELALYYCASNIRRMINIKGIMKIIEYLDKRLMKKENMVWT